MDWMLILFFAFTLSMITVIGLLLASLAKQGDERKKFIKTKTMADTFVLVVGMLLLFIGESIYKVILKDDRTISVNPFTFLVTISIVFLILLLFNKRKYGDYYGK